MSRKGDANWPDGRHDVTLCRLGQDRTGQGAQHLKQFPINDNNVSFRHRSPSPPPYGIFSLFWPGSKYQANKPSGREELRTGAGSGMQASFYDDVTNVALSRLTDMKL